MTLTTRRLRLTTAIAAVLGAVAVAPAGALASTTWFGSSLNHEPANAGTSCSQDDTMPAPLCTHVGSFYPGTSGRAHASTNGTIVKIKVRAAGATTLHFQLVRVRNLSSDEMHGQAKVVADGPTLNVTGPTQDQMDNGIFPVETFPVHIRVKRGQELAVTTDNNQAEYCSDGTPGQLTFFNPTLGNAFQTNTGVDNCLLLVQAVVRH